MALFTQDHVGEALRRLPSQFKKKPNFQKLIEIFGERAQKLEDVVAAVAVAFNLDTAIGKTLDILGKTLGLPRYGYPDNTYRLHLSVQALLLLAGRGTLRITLRIVRAFITDPARKIHYQEAYPMGYIITVDDLTQEEADVLKRFLEYARPTAYGFKLLKKEINGFVFDSVQPFVPNGLGFGSVYDAGLGGGLGHVF